MSDNELNLLTQVPDIKCDAVNERSAQITISTGYRAANRITAKNWINFISIITKKLFLLTILPDQMVTTDLL